MSSCSFIPVVLVALDDNMMFYHVSILVIFICVLTRIGLDEATKEQMRKILSQKESNYLRSKRAKMDKSQFKTIKTIGLGAFGEVMYSAIP